MRIVIPGGSGHVGRMLSRYFHDHRHDVTVLSRTPESALWKTAAWDGRTLGAWAATLEGCDACINLAGRSVNCRYNATNRAEIYNSRIDSTRVLGEAISRAARPPRVWLNASTATIYRHALDQPMNEATGDLGGNEPGAPKTWNFSIKVARDWETSFFAADTPQMRKVAMRCAVIMSAEPGAPFSLLSRLVRLGAGGANASGEQFISWVHETDFVRAVEWLIANESMDGAVNIASPHPLPNQEFMRVLRAAWGRRIAIPSSPWMLEAAAFVLRTETELILKSRRVVPGRLLQAGFPFEFPQWPSAAGDLVAQCRRSAAPGAH
jgi:uncharacterized protein